MVELATWPKPVGKWIPDPSNTCYYLSYFSMTCAFLDLVTSMQCKPTSISNTPSGSQMHQLPTYRRSFAPLAPRPGMPRPDVMPRWCRLWHMQHVTCQLLNLFLLMASQDRPFFFGALCICKPTKTHEVDITLPLFFLFHRTKTKTTTN